MAWSKTPGDVQLINISARLFIETDNQSCETFDQSVGEIDRWKGKQGKCRPMRSTQPIWLSDVASRKLTGGEGGRERGRGSLGIGWPLGSLVVSGITLFPRTNLLLSAPRGRVRHWPTLTTEKPGSARVILRFVPPITRPGHIRANQFDLSRLTHPMRMTWMFLRIFYRVAHDRVINFFQVGDAKDGQIFSTHFLKYCH